MERARGHPGADGFAMPRMSGERLKRSRCGRLIALALLGLAEVTAGTIAGLATMRPAVAQSLDDRFPFMEDRVRRNRQYQQQQPFNPFGYGDQPRQAGDSSRAPPPRKPDVPPTT